MIVKRSSIPDIKQPDSAEKRPHVGVGDLSGEPEEYDNDPQAGSGKFSVAIRLPKGDGADTPNHGSR